MGITNSNKVISTQQIDCDGSLKVTLALTAAPDIISNPVDMENKWKPMTRRSELPGCTLIG